MKPYDFQPGDKVFFVKWNKGRAKIFKGTMFIKSLDQIKDEEGKTLEVNKCAVEFLGGIMAAIYDTNLYLDTASEMNRVKKMIRQIEREKKE